MSVQQGLRSVTLENTAATIASAGTGPSSLQYLCLPAPGPHPAAGTQGLSEAMQDGPHTSACKSRYQHRPGASRPEMAASAPAAVTSPHSPPPSPLLVPTAHRTSQPHKPNYIGDAWAWLVQTRLCVSGLSFFQGPARLCPRRGTQMPPPGGLYHSSNATSSSPSSPPLSSFSLAVPRTLQRRTRGLWLHHSRAHQ